MNFGNNRFVPDWKECMALAIMFHAGEKELSEEQTNAMLDLEGEYQLIRNKVSDLPRAKRDEIVYVWESLQRLAAAEKAEADGTTK